MNFGDIALKFLFTRDQIKIYHWQTKSFARHKSSDELVDALSSKLDKFIEVMQGKYDRIMIPKNKYSFFDVNDESIVDILTEFRSWLIADLPKNFDKKKDTDLMNIRDDILADINQTLYLFTFE